MNDNQMEFIACIIFALVFWPLIVFDRIFLGKHTWNQVFLGSQLGFLTALFLHFCIRDSLHDHINYIMKTGQNFHYVLRRYFDVLFITIALFGTGTIMMVILAHVVEMP